MVLAGRMGFRYLWVDALCIRQDDNEDKSAQLDQMDQIYSRALVTIVPEPHSFRPGIETIEGIQLSRFAEPFRASVLSSEWDTRGWTLQEKLLSHRVIVMTPTQMFWKCSQGTWYEDCEFETPLVHSIAAKSDWGFFEESADHFDHYQHLATAFVFRKFTLEKNAEDAIKGISHKLSAGLGSAFHCGIPEKYLDAVVLWEWPGACNRTWLPRVKHFPSWSWISLSIHDGTRAITDDHPPVLWGAVTNVTEYMNSHTRLRRAKWPKICSLVEYYRFYINGDATKIESSVFQDNTDKEFAEYLIERQLLVHLPMLPLRFNSSVEEYVGLATVLRTNPQAHCLFPHTMHVLLPQMFGFFAQTACLYVSPAVEPVTMSPRPTKFDFALDESKE